MLFFLFTHFSNLGFMPEPKFRLETAHWTGSDIYFHVVPPSGHMPVSASAAAQRRVGWPGLWSCRRALPGALHREYRKKDSSRTG